MLLITDSLNMGAYSSDNVETHCIFTENNDSVIAPLMLPEE